MYIFCSKALADANLGKHGNMLWAFANGYDESVNAVDKM